MQIQKLKIAHKKYDGKKIPTQGVWFFLKVNEMQDSWEKKNSNTEVTALMQWTKQRCRSFNTKFVSPINSPPPQ